MLEVCSSFRQTGYHIRNPIRIFAKVSAMLPRTVPNGGIFVSFTYGIEEILKGIFAMMQNWQGWHFGVAEGKPVRIWS